MTLKMLLQLLAWIEEQFAVAYYFIKEIIGERRIENVAFVDENAKKDAVLRKEQVKRKSITQSDQISETVYPEKVFPIERKETLLELSLRFKRENPEKYTMRQKERKIRHDKLFGIAPHDPRVDEINSLLNEELSKKYHDSVRRKNMPPLLNVCFQFVELTKKNKSHDGSLTNLFTEDRNNISKFEYKDTKQTKNASSLAKKTHEKEQNMVELKIITHGASNLHKWAQSEEGKFKTRAVCAIHPDSDMYGPEMATPYIKPGYNMVTRWRHIFIFGGFTFDQIANRMITFTIETQTSHGKRRFGYINLSARGCILGRVNHSDEDLCNSNSNFWSEYLQNPRDSLEVNLPIFPATHEVGKSATLLQRVGSSRRSPAKIPKLTPLKNSRSASDIRRCDEI